MRIGAVESLWRYPVKSMRGEEMELPRWRDAAAKLKADGKEPGREPPPPPKPGTVRDQKPGYLYEAHIRPLVGYGIRGVLWDQGESGTQLGGETRTAQNSR